MSRGTTTPEKGALISDSEDIQQAVTHFATRFHAGVLQPGAANYISSPLGAWVLLAQLAGANSAALSEENRYWAEEVLGLSARRAFELSTALLREVPESVRLACAAWVDNTRDEVHKEWLWGLRRTETAAVAEHLPTQAELDRWANEHTLGMIKKFPLELNPDVFFVLATAIATRIKWARPFERSEVASNWGTAALLHDAGKKVHAYLIEDDQRRVHAVHIARGENIEVLSVIAEDPSVPEAEVLALAEKLAVDKIYPAHLPKANSPLYTAQQRRGTADSYEVWLPAWQARNTLDFTGVKDLHLPALATGAIKNVEELAAAQSAYAKYGREGFEAAAVTGLIAMRAAVPVSRKVTHYQIRYDHTYAVVARYAGWERKHALWGHLPLFSGIVREADEVDA